MSIGGYIAALVGVITLILGVVSLSDSVTANREYVRDYVDGKFDTHVESIHDGAATQESVDANCYAIQVLSQWLAVQFGKQAPAIFCGVGHQDKRHHDDRHK